LLKETTGAFDRAFTHDWQTTDFESITLPICEQYTIYEHETNCVSL